MSKFIVLARVIDRIGAPLSKYKNDDTKTTTMMPYGAMLKIPDSATANEDPKDGYQQQQPLWVYAPFWAPAAPAVPAGRHSDRDSQKAGLRDESSPDKTGNRRDAPAPYHA